VGGRPAGTGRYPVAGIGAHWKHRGMPPSTAGSLFDEFLATGEALQL
jgi:hypothetical protein